MEGAVTLEVYSDFPIGRHRRKSDIVALETKQIKIYVCGYSRYDPLVGRLTTL